MNWIHFCSWIFILYMEIFMSVWCMLLCSTLVHQCTNVFKSFLLEKDEVWKWMLLWQNFKQKKIVLCCFCTKFCVQLYWLYILLIKFDVLFKHPGNNARMTYQLRLVYNSAQHFMVTAAFIKVHTTFQSINSQDMKTMLLLDFSITNTFANWRWNYW